ncbi:MAG TPA: hypothetical protein VFD46_04485 [Chryseolinea sp.]|nr:hypothetical protein [Chryseolinea sp.]
MKTPKFDRIYFVTGTLHGSHIQAKCEGDARRAFHKLYNGESITHVKSMELKEYFI